MLWVLLMSDSTQKVKVLSVEYDYDHQEYVINWECAGVYTVVSKKSDALFYVRNALESFEENKEK